MHACICHNRCDGLWHTCNNFTEFFITKACQSGADDTQREIPSFKVRCCLQLQKMAIGVTGQAYFVNRCVNQAFVSGFPCGFSMQPTVLQFLGLAPEEPFFVPALVFIDKTGVIRSQYIGDEKFLGNPEVNIRAELDKIIKLGGGGPLAPAK